MSAYRGRQAQSLSGGENSVAILLKFRLAIAARVK